MQLWAFLEERELTRVGDFDEHAVNLSRVHLREKGASENTISNRLRAIKAFARWMDERGWTRGNVLATVSAPQLTKPHFDLIPDNLRAQLFRLYNQDTYLASRNLAILALLADTGLRREEVVNLLLKNADPEAHVLKVSGPPSRAPARASGGPERSSRRSWCATPTISSCCTRISRPSSAPSRSPPSGSPAWGWN